MPPACFFFFFKQKTAYEITYGDWSSDVCSSDLWDALRLQALARSASAKIGRTPGKARDIMENYDASSSLRNRSIAHERQSLSIRRPRRHVDRSLTTIHIRD